MLHSGKPKDLEVYSINRELPSACVVLLHLAVEWGAD